MAEEGPPHRKVGFENVAEEREFEIMNAPLKVRNIGSTKQYQTLRNRNGGNKVRRFAKNDPRVKAPDYDDLLLYIKDWYRRAPSDMARQIEAELGGRKVQPENLGDLDLKKAEKTYEQYRKLKEKEQQELQRSIGRMLRGENVPLRRFSIERPRHKLAMQKERLLDLKRYLNTENEGGNHGEHMRNMASRHTVDQMLARVIAKANTNTRKKAEVLQTMMELEGKRRPRSTVHRMVGRTRRNTRSASPRMRHYSSSEESESK